jgi:hypothetical protein
MTATKPAKRSRRTGSVVFRCGSAETRLTLTVRDVRLLDGDYFLTHSGYHYRAYFGLDFISGLGAPPVGQVLKKYKRPSFIAVLTSLLQDLEDHRDLISFSYEYRFSGNRERSGGGGASGFRVRGLFGSIDATPSGYCTLVLSDSAPSGRGRLVEVIDMRVRKSIETDDWGTLSIRRRAAPVSWFDELPRLLEWLRGQAAPEVEILHE